MEHKKRFVAGNWKMNGSLEQNRHLLNALLETVKDSEAEIVVFPPAIYIQQVASIVNGSNIKVGVQNVSPEAKRNHTNEILLPFKVGAVVMAQRTNCNIIPYSITGDYKFRSKNLKITFGKPLDVSKLTVEKANELLYEKVKELLLDSRK